MEYLIESDIKREIGDNPFDFLAKYKIPSGWMVSIGYFNDHAIPTSRRRINIENDVKLAAFIEGLPEGQFKQALVNFRNDPKYANALEYSKIKDLIDDPNWMAGLEKKERSRIKKLNKTADITFGPNCHIIKFGRFNLNWKINSDLDKFYDNRRNDELKVRAKYNFDGTPGTWRDNYGGPGLQPKASSNRPGNAYVEWVGDDTGFWMNPNNKTEIALRLLSNPKASRSSLWFFIDDTGKMMPLDKNVMAFLCYAYSSKTPSQVIQTMNGEEKDFLNDLKSIKNWDRSEMTMLLSNILYFTGSGFMDEEQPDGTINKVKKPFTWLNDSVINTKYPWFSKENIYELIEIGIKLSQEDLNKYKNNIIDESVDFAFSQLKNIPESLLNKISYDDKKGEQVVKRYRNYRELNESRTNYLNFLRQKL